VLAQGGKNLDLCYSFVWVGDEVESVVGEAGSVRLARRVCFWNRQCASAVARTGRGWRQNL